MKKLIAISLLSIGLFACGQTPTQEINRLTKPVTIAGISTDGAVMLYGADGCCVILPGNYYAAQAIREGRKAGDVLIPATGIISIGGGK